jgi:hypothetical protein
VAESITITDNRTGESVEIPIVDGGVDAAAWRKAAARHLVLRPGVHDHRRHDQRAITELDGEAGHPRYRGYPIEQLAEQSTYLEVAYLLIHGELPTAEQYEPWVTRSPTTRSSTRTCASGSWRASTTTPTPWACWSRPSPRCRPSTPRPRTSTTRTTATSRSSGSSPRCPRSPPAPPLQRRACPSSTPTTASTSPPTSCR